MQSWDPEDRVRAKMAAESVMKRVAPRPLQTEDINLNTKKVRIWEGEGVQG